jgi:hypothetical protein
MNMLRFEPETTHADWFIRESGNWQELVTAGPRGYAADVRVLPLDGDDISERGMWSRIRPHLGRSTATPDDCFHTLWGGANGIASGDEPGFTDSVLKGPKIKLVDEYGHSVREYRLFRGPVDDVGDWGAVDPKTGRSLDDDLPPPHLLWPSDRAWTSRTTLTRTTRGSPDPKPSSTRSWPIQP